MASSHLLRILRPTCNYRQNYLSRTLPLYTGLFYRHSSTVNEPVKRSRKSETAKPNVAQGPELTDSSTEPVKRKRRSGTAIPKVSRRRRPELTEEELNVSKLTLPPIDKWRQYFAIMEGQRLRFFLRNPDTARMLAEAFVPEGSKDLIVIEAASGPGQLTRALLDLPKERIKKLIALEKPEKLLDFLKPLEEVDSRFHVFPWPPKEWHSYTKLFSTGLLDEIQTVDWNEVHPQLRFILHINSTVEGEQLLAQLLRAIPDRQWLFKYGRVQMHFILSSRMWDRVKSPTFTVIRCKVSVMAQAAAELSETVPYDALQPFQDHFHPTVPKHEEITKGTILDERKTGNPMSAITVIPLEDQAIVPGDLDYWDYCLRKLFVQKATPLNKCISLLGPGAKNLLPKLNDKNLPLEERVDTKKSPRELEMYEWKLVVKVFKEWPFKPEDLSIDNFLVSNSRF